MSVGQISGGILVGRGFCTPNNGSFLFGFALLPTRERALLTPFQKPLRKPGVLRRFFRRHHSNLRKACRCGYPNASDFRRIVCGHPLISRTTSFGREMRCVTSDLRERSFGAASQPRSRPVRRHIIWNNLRPDLKEDLAHLVQDIRRRICGIASAGSPSFSV